MNVEMFVLCDAATDHAGKLNLLGAYDTIVGAQLPVQCPTLVLATRIRFRPEEQGGKNCEIRIMDYDGRAVLPPISATMAVTVPETRDSAAVNLIVNINGIAFQRPGKYRIDLVVDARVAASLPVEVLVRGG